MDAPTLSPLNRVPAAIDTTVAQTWLYEPRGAFSLAAHTALLVALRDRPQPLARPSTRHILGPLGGEIPGARLKGGLGVQA